MPRAGARGSGHGPVPRIAATRAGHVGLLVVAVVGGGLVLGRDAGTGVRLRLGMGVGLGALGVVVMAMGSTQCGRGSGR